MPNLYIITGPAGVGKSTVSKLLAEKLDKSALIEGDDIYSQVVGSYIEAWKPGNHLNTFWKVCISSIKTYLEDGYDVIFNYIVGPEALENLKHTFKEYSIKFIVLMVDEETLLKRDNERPEDCRMYDRCIVLLNNFKRHGFSENNILDTSNITAKEAVEIIENENRFII